MVTGMAMGDPYLTLELSKHHNATQAQIKEQYRRLARRYHPDRHTTSSAEQRYRATTKFADIATAYALLSDVQRKAEYDHIYKYGGYDDDVSKHNRNDNTATGFRTAANPGNTTTATTSSSHRKGVGYSCTNPFAFVFTNGRVRSTRTVAGVSIPSRYGTNSFGGNGIQFAMQHHCEFNRDSTSSSSNSSGKQEQNPGRTYTTRTTRFVQGRKVETTETLLPDGRRQVVTSDGFGNRQTRWIHNDQPNQQRPSTPNRMPESTAATSASDNSFWQGLREKLVMCYNPCAVVTAQ